MMVAIGLQGCAMTPEQAGSVMGSAAAGATIGALAGAALSPKGRGRRGEGAVRGALGGAAIEGLLGLSQQGGHSYGGGYGSGRIPEHCQGYGDPRSRQICTQAAYRSLAQERQRARRAADREAMEQGRSWRR